MGSGDELGFLRRLRKHLRPLWSSELWLQLPENVLLTNVLVAALLAISYVVVLTVREPAFSGTVWVTHWLLVLAMSTVFFAATDICTLDWIVRTSRDPVERASVLRVFCDKDSLESVIQAIRQGNSSGHEPGRDLMGGLLWSALRGAVLCQDLTTFKSFLDDRLLDQRLGRNFLTFSMRSATLLGLLGTVLGLKATFDEQAMSGASAFKMTQLLPSVGVALVTTMLGLVVSLFGLAACELVMGLQERELRESFLPLVNRICTTLELIEPPVVAVGGQSGPSSRALRLFRLRVAGLMLLVVPLVMLWLGGRGGFLDQILTVKVREHTDLVSVPTHVAPPVSQPTPAAEPAPDVVATPTTTARIAPAAVLKQLEFAVEIAGERYHWSGGYPQFEDPIPREDLAGGESEHAHKASQDRFRIAGIVDLVDPVLGDAVDRRFPRLVARIDVALYDASQGDVEVAFTFLDGKGEPTTKSETDGFSFFLESQDKSLSGWPLVGASVRIAKQTAITSYAEKNVAFEGGTHQRRVVWASYEDKTKLEYLRRRAPELDDLTLEQNQILAFCWTADPSGNPQVERAVWLPSVWEADPERDFSSYCRGEGVDGE